MGLLGILIAIVVLIFIVGAILFAVLFYGSVAYFIYRIFKFLLQMLVLDRIYRQPEPKKKDF